MNMLLTNGFEWLQFVNQPKQLILSLASNTKMKVRVAYGNSITLISDPTKTQVGENSYS